MKQTINIYDFERAFETMNRNENFSYEGKKALFEYLEEYEDSCDQEIELDVIALCCEYTEYEDVKDFLDNYQPSEIDIEREEDETEEEQKERIKAEVEDYLNDNTQLIKLDDDLDDGFIVQNF